MSGREGTAARLLWLDAAFFGIKSGTTTLVGPRIFCTPPIREVDRF